MLFNLCLEIITFIIDDSNKAKYPNVEKKFNLFQTTICDIVEYDNNLIVYIVDEFIDRYKK
jgi:hypothetical protein